MNFGEAIGHNIRNAFTFTGRDPRSAFWWYVLFWYLGSLVANVIDGMRWITIAPALLENLGLGAAPDAFFTELANHPWIMLRFFPVSIVWMLIGIAPLFACGIRRRHDCDRSGTFFAVLFLGSIAVSIGGALYMLDAMSSFVAAIAPVEGISAVGPASPEDVFLAEFSTLFAVAAILNLVLWTAVIVIIILMATKGTHGPNRYGPDPLGPPPMPQP